MDLKYKISKNIITCLLYLRIRKIIIIIIIKKKKKVRVIKKRIRRKTKEF